MEQLFNLAAGHLANIVDEISSDTKDDDLLYLYARYKQATIGPCNTSKPGIINAAARKKWNCWKSLKKMSKEQAMKEYIEKIQTLDKSWNSRAATVRSGMGVAVSVMNQNNERVLTDGEKTVFDYCKEGSLEKVMVLFDGFPKDEQDRTLLHWACDRGNLKIAQFLISKGHDVNCKDNESSTPLHYAASCDYVEIVELLLANHADVTIEDSDGDTPLDCVSAEKTKLAFEKYSS